VILTMILFGRLNRHVEGAKNGGNLGILGMPYLAGRCRDPPIRFGDC
jgi:hypothetical protein